MHGYACGRKALNDFPPPCLIHAERHRGGLTSDLTYPMKRILNTFLIEQTLNKRKMRQMEEYALQFPCLELLAGIDVSAPPYLSVRMKSQYALQ